MLAKEKLGKTVTIRNTPSILGANVGSVLPFTQVTYTAIVDDLGHAGDPAYKWLNLGLNRYVNYIYPPAGLRFDLIDITPPPPPPPANDPINHVIVVHDSGAEETFVPEK